VSGNSEGRKLLHFPAASRSSEVLVAERCCHTPPKIGSVMLEGAPGQRFQSSAPPPRLMAVASRGFLCGELERLARVTRPHALASTNRQDQP
jgi:hypothetical protein